MSKNYFHEKENFPQAAGGDISLYFEPVFDPTEDAQDNEVMKFVMVVGSLVIPTGADEITWGYGLNTKRIPTYGGEVVQILSMFSDKMTISGTCRSYNEQRKIYEYFKNYIAYTTGAKDTRRHQKFLRFRYPARGWSFVIMVQDIGNMRMGKDVAAPTWSLTAEVVSENDRYMLGVDRIDRWANVLKTPVAKTTARSAAINPDASGDTTSGPSSRKGGGGTKKKNRISGPKNFKLIRDGDPFGDLIDPIGRRGKIAANFDALVASWATGDITTLRNNPLVDPERSAEDIWNLNFGDFSGFFGGTGGGGGALQAGAPGGVSYGTKQRVFATSFGGAGDASNTGHADGQAFDLVANPDSYAELSTNKYNSANYTDGKTPDGKKNDYAALGKLAALTPIRVTNPKNNKSMVLYKRDVGFGGNGPDGVRGTKDDPKIDIWHMAAKKLDFSGFDYLDIEIGTVTSGATFSFVNGEAAYPLPDPKQGEWNGGVADHTSRYFGNWQSDYACDIGRPAGTPVYAVADGRLATWPGTVFSGSFSYTAPGGKESKSYGLSMHLNTKFGIFFYTHLQKNVPSGIVPGAYVKAGQIIGYVHPATFSHLHFAMEQPFEGDGVNPIEHRVENFLASVVGAKPPTPSGSGGSGGSGGTGGNGGSTSPPDTTGLNEWKTSKEMTITLGDITNTIEFALATKLFPEPEGFQFAIDGRSYILEVNHPVWPPTSSNPPTGAGATSWFFGGDNSTGVYIGFGPVTKGLRIVNDTMIIALQVNMSPTRLLQLTRDPNRKITITAKPFVHGLNGKIFGQTVSKSFIVPLGSRP